MPNVPPISTRLASRYRLVRRLGEGAGGTVYSAHDEALGLDIAIKILTDDDRALQRAQHEVRLARRVTHPNVCRVFDLGEWTGGHFLTMEVLDARSLGRLRLTDAAAFEVVRSVARGLAASHVAGVVHCDVKPENILVGSERTCLTDFGVALDLHADRPPGSWPAGTLRYMAPEQVRADPIGPPADVFALGVVLYQLLVGEPPFPGSPVRSAIARLEQGAPLTDVGLATAHIELLRAMLQPDPGDRPSAEQVAEQAGEIADTTSGSHVRRRRPTATRPLPRVRMDDFEVQGREEAMFAGGLQEDVRDLLRRTHGLELGGADSADLVLTGRVKSAAGKVRVGLRLARPDGFQVWSGHCSADFASPFEAQEILALRIAGMLLRTLRRFAIRSARGEGVAESFERAEYALHTDGYHADGAVDVLDEALAGAPDSPPVISLHAVATARAAAFSEDLDQPRVRTLLAHRSLQRALRLAPLEADTHLARALELASAGDVVQQMEALREGLEFVPTHAAILAQLGELFVMGGRRRTGEGLLQKALAVDPQELTARRRLARLAAFDGDRSRAAAHLAAASQRAPGDVLLQLLVARIHHYFGERIDECWSGGSAVRELGALLLRVMARKETTRGLDRIEGSLAPWVDNASIRSGLATLLAEAAFLGGDPERAVRTIERASRVFLDLDWLERCPLVPVQIRQQKRWQVLVASVRARLEPAMTRAHILTAQVA